MNNEVNIEDLEKLLHEARGMYSDSEKKLDENTRRLGMMEEELKRSEERATMCDTKIKELEDELRAVGESMKVIDVLFLTSHLQVIESCNISEVKLYILLLCLTLSATLHFGVPFSNIGLNIIQRTIIGNGSKSMFLF